ncbi:WhiB family transcriptional regulator [Rhodococcus sp. KBS0724]|nr:WhiB family transcriptional regulator [Rhodococcus sp. KBS0724]
MRRENAAKKICGDCPVRSHCLTHALDTPEPHGVWGAMTERERAGTKNPATAQSAPLAS